MAQEQSTIRTLLLTSVALAALAACEGFDPDMRDLGNGFSTASAVQDLPKRPSPDDRGVISYPTYQVVVAQQDDTIRSIAIRLVWMQTRWRNITGSTLIRSCAATRSWPYQAACQTPPACP